MDEFAFIVNEPDDDEVAIQLAYYHITNRGGVMGELSSYPSTYPENDDEDLIDLSIQEDEVPGYVYDLLEALFHQSATTVDFKNHKVPKEVAVWVRRAVDAGFVSSWKGGVIDD